MNVFYIFHLLKNCNRSVNTVVRSQHDNSPNSLGQGKVIAYHDMNGPHLLWTKEKSPGLQRHYLKRMIDV